MFWSVPGWLAHPGEGSAVWPTRWSELIALRLVLEFAKCKTSVSGSICSKIIPYHHQQLQRVKISKYTFGTLYVPVHHRRGRPADYHHGLRYSLSDIATYGELSLAGRISFTNRAPLLWNMLPREVQTSSSMLVFKKKVLSLLDCPVSGKNFLQICFGNTTI